MDSNGWNSLHYVARNNDVTIMKPLLKLVTSSGSHDDVNKQTLDGWTALMVCVKKQVSCVCITLIQPEIIYLMNTSLNHTLKS